MLLKPRGDRWARPRIPTHSARRRFRGGGFGSRREREGGFSLIEALVALAVVAVTLSAIGAAFGSNVQTTRGLEDRLALDGEGQLIMTALPDRAQIRAGPYAGVVDGDPWKMQITDLTAGNSGKAPVWRPVAIVITLRTPAGRTLQLNTIRLARAPASGG